MIETFPKSLRFVLRWEGGYTNDPHDPGGETNLGISRRAYPTLDIKSLTEQDAMAIYHRDYWIKAGCDDLPCPMDWVVFDTAVNMGVKKAKVILQESTDWRDYLLNRIGYYSKMDRRYLAGWINRVIDLKKSVG